MITLSDNFVIHFNNFKLIIILYYTPKSLFKFTLASSPTITDNMVYFICQLINDLEYIELSCYLVKTPTMLRLFTIMY